ncbi:glycosyltransferase [Saccharopolyspora terrae]|uniref:glycosyltransferase n=1 Tax=Saccharopolyspora terrae TaxID=2530384 RepID=UPI0014052A3B|nr:glycosyltransferase [Saccharopolyspora terrae]
MEWVLLFLVFGINVPVWTMIAILRGIGESRMPAPGETAAPANRMRPDEVAIVIPAHDEEGGIAKSITSALRIVPAANVHVLADGCRDRTAEIAAGFGVRVLDLSPGRGKAGAIEAAIGHFDITHRFGALLIVDADTEVDPDYLTNGLPMLDDPRYAAVAGYVRTPWTPQAHTFIGRLLISYRSRLWTIMQWMRYGQSWRYINVTPIVPGFAGMYRTSVLPRMDINPPGLIIEDFNMTFELHHKRLGKIAFSPSVQAWTEDPDNLRDYYQQVRRWALGLWQTLRRHGAWFGRFWFATAVFMLEVVSSSLIILGLVVVGALMALGPLTGGWVLDWPVYREVHSALEPWLSAYNVVFFLFLPDYLITCVVAVLRRRPSLLVYGFGFLLVRFIDAAATMWTLYRVWRANSSGRWTSPRRLPPVLPPRGQAEAPLASEMSSPAQARWVVLRDAMVVLPVAAVVGLALADVLSAVLVAVLLVAAAVVTISWRRRPRREVAAVGSATGDRPPGRV